ncbi:hypothetical protein QR680_007090 [Steinernema hermaphroditum]|uniref:Uncharacterized protein n=1 Tax=Steinernema hermaphroditum TaxID=289476 RepID=A0AA39HXL1_9BILA|nr:hypothetical protein QR680_007090 [Steinernema hermaphroditum]
MQIYANECFVVRKTKMNRYDRPLSKPVKPSDVLDWIRSVSKTPLREIPGVGLVFKTFDTLMTVAGYQPASPVMNFLREFREDMQREFRKIYHVILNVDYQRMHRELQTLSKTKLISGLLQYYFEAPDIQIKETYLCDMCNTEPAIILHKLLLESRIIPDYLLTEYYEKLSKDQLAILDYTHSEYAIESQNQLKDLAEKMLNNIGHHFGITISIFLIDFADEVDESNIHANKNEYKKRFWRVDLGRSKAFLFAVEPSSYVPQNAWNGISWSSTVALMDLCDKHGKYFLDEMWPSRKVPEINFVVQVRQRRYVGRTFRTPQPPSAHGVHTCKTDIYGGGFRDDNLVVFAANFVDYSA